MIFRLILLCFCFVVSISDFALSANSWNDSFNKSKRMLEDDVYLSNEDRKTIYCDAQFYEDKSINLPKDFITEKHVKRAERIEWEHVVPAENFGRNFVEWREGHPLCVDSKGKSYKGRKCAEKVNEEFRLMQADMYNLYPSIGAVNATRSNYNFAMLPEEKSDFGVCEMKIEDRKVEPPQESRGKIARAYIYMESSYPLYNMSKQQRQLMTAWSNQYPVTHDECERTRRIEEIQGNTNEVVKNLCEQKSLW